jgi:hypothetical protein
VRRSTNSRIRVFWVVVGLTLLVWLLRGVGLLTMVPGFILALLFGLSLLLFIVNGLIETR